VNGIAQPAGFMQILINGNGKMQTTCAPCHPAVDTVMNAVTNGPAGLVAVGYVIQDLPGAIWHSADGASWSYESDFPKTSLFQSVAADSTRYVAFGRDGDGVTAWSSIDGTHWQPTTSTGAFAGGPFRPGSVTHWSGGFVAAGSAGTEFFSAKAAFWASADGLTWRRAPDSPELADARAIAVTSGGPGLVAVGLSGPADKPGPAAIWTSPDGLHWTRVPDSPALHDARLRAIANVPGIGLVAAGENLAGSFGAVLTSTDGRHWHRAPSSPALGRADIQLRMFGVIAGGPGVVIVGTETVGIQYGHAVLWTSSDGRTWSATGNEQAFSDGELSGVAAWNSRLVAVGDRGEPDTYISQVWMSPDGWVR
jgi:hypothetical protein